MILARLRIFASSLVILALGLLTGCFTGNLSAIDRQVTDLLREQQLASLGAANKNDPNHIPRQSADAGESDRTYSKNPSTNHPAAANLPAARVPPGQAPRDPANPDVDIADFSKEPVVEMDLEAALTYAIEHAPDYRSRKEALFLAAIDLLIERHLWGPRFFNDLTAAFSGTPEAGDHSHVLSLVNEFRATQRLPYGGDISVRAIVNFVEQLRTASSSSADDSQSAELRLTATIPLLRGAGIVAQESLIQANRDLVYATRDFEQFRQQFVVSTSSVYFSLLQEQSRIVNLESQVKNLEWLSGRIEALAIAGREPYFEVQRSQQQVLFARNNLLTARERYSRLLDGFKIQIGMNPTRRLTLLPTDVEVPIPQLHSEQATKTAFSLRLDLQTAEDQIDDARRSVNIARNNLQPDLDLFADVRLPTDPDKRFGGVALDARSGSYSVGATFGVPIDRRTEQLSHRASLINLERSQRSFTLLRDLIASDVRSSVRQITSSQSTLDIQNRNVALAHTRRDGVVLRLRTLGPREFIESEDDLRQALDERDQAVRDLRVNVLKYLVDTGQMRVTGTGRWEPPAKLVPAELPPGVPPANAQMGPQAERTDSKAPQS